MRVADIVDLTTRVAEVKTAILFVQKEKRTARLIVVSLIDVSQSNSAWIKIIVCIIVVRLTSWYYSSSPSFAHHPTSHDK
jgi:hypothetical protein